MYIILFSYQPLHKFTGGASQNSFFSPFSHEGGMRVQWFSRVEKSGRLGTAAVRRPSAEVFQQPVRARRLERGGERRRSGSLDPTTRPSLLSPFCFLSHTSSLLALTSSLRAFFNWLRAIFNRSAGIFNESAGIFNWLAAFGEVHMQLKDTRSQWCERRDFLGLPWWSSFGRWRPSGSLGPTIRPAAFPTSSLFPLTSSLCLPLRHPP